MINKVLLASIYWRKAQVRNATLDFMGALNTYSPGLLDEAVEENDETDVQMIRRILNG